MCAKSKQKAGVRGLALLQRNVTLLTMHESGKDEMLLLLSLCEELKATMRPPLSLIFSGLNKLRCLSHSSHILPCRHFLTVIAIFWHPKVHTVLEVRPTCTEQSEGMSLFPYCHREIYLILFSSN